MQTILGANGPIAIGLARELHQQYTRDIRLVSRNPVLINETDQLYPANLLDAVATEKAVAGSEIAYLTVGLPMNSQVWETQFPLMMKNVIGACKKQNCKLVFFDNTYMYPKTSEPQTEETSFRPAGRKSVVRARIAGMLLDEMAQQKIEAVICRAPEFYGPGKTQSITNALVFENIRRQKKLKVPVSDKTLRTLIWTPDASRAMALVGNTPDAYQQTWHLPCDDHRLNYQSLVALAAEIYQRKLRYSVLPMWKLRLGALFRKPVREIQELLPRYQCDNIFISDKFKNRFPGFQITSYHEGIIRIWQEQTGH